MKRCFYYLVPLFLLLLSSYVQAGLFSDNPVPIEKIKLPHGFKIQLFASDVENARSMAWNGNNTLYVGTRRAGSVYALVDVNGDYKADKKYVIADGLRMPNGIVYHQGDLYVAENHRIIKYEKIDTQLVNPPEPEVIYGKLPTEGHHGWRYLNLGPDNRLYVAIGAPCNICEEPDYAVIARLDLDGSNFVIVARVLCSVGAM